MSGVLSTLPIPRFAGTTSGARMDSNGATYSLTRASHLRKGLLTTREQQRRSRKVSSKQAILRQNRELTFQNYRTRYRQIVWTKVNTPQFWVLTFVFFLYVQIQIVLSPARDTGIRPTVSRVPVASA